MNRTTAKAAKLPGSSNLRRAGALAAATLMLPAFVAACMEGRGYTVR